ncbi:hypothetical protein E3O42_00650 [Cryobacterium adonitolivorans]|uniref:DUF4157 domain-containing protein n=1 Tax=Cryobacterium adonitolivorans TaxID=1259189 RepID=A0A4R8WHP1_9MICO|nr:hypothetical protein [Cryobacterium adonitolivorans]TFC06929.1 hypothetical protein E3O42_00650 [Cryobacterium adonitolivorans]
MRSLTQSIRRINGPWPTRDIPLESIAAYVGMPAPISLTGLMDRLDAVPNHRDWDTLITFDAGIALGGTVGISIESNGSWRFHGALHGSGFDSYSFRITAVLRASDDSVILSFVHAGGVGGAIEGGSRDHSWDESSQFADPRRRLVQENWPAVASGVLRTMAQAKDTGLGGSLVSALEDVAAVVVAAVAFGPAVGATLMIGAVVGEALHLAGGPGELAGLLVIGGGMFLVAEGIFLPVLPLAVTAWAATNAVVQHRTLRPDEMDFANAVFHGSLPPADKITLTNLATITGRAFTWPNVDGSTLVNMPSSAAVDDPVHFKRSPGDTPGRLLIHELTHAWQMAHTDFMPVMVCDAITGHTITEPIEGKSALYKPEPGLAWSQYSMEQQASIVDMWFAGVVTYQTPPTLKPMDEHNPWFYYIEHYLWPTI